jgi:hypothetical protein
LASTYIGVLLGVIPKLKFLKMLFFSSKEKQAGDEMLDKFVVQISSYGLTLDMFNLFSYSFYNSISSLVSLLMNSDSPLSVVVVVDEY